MSDNEKVPVGERALAQRINRKLRHDDELLRKTRERWVPEMGNYYTLSFNNVIQDMHVDLESLGRELGALGSWEKVVWTD